MQKRCENCLFERKKHYEEPCTNCVVGGCGKHSENNWQQKPETGTTKPEPCTVYQAIGFKIGELVADKQAAYGDMIRGAQDIFKILYPNGIKTEQYDDALLVLRVMDKIGRICRGQKKAFGESPWRDICGYAILGAEQDERVVSGGKNNA